MKVRDIMTAEVATAAPETTLNEIATMMRDEDTGTKTTRKRRRAG